MAVPLIDRRVGRKTIEITAAIDIPNPNAEATGEHHIEWRVVTCTILLFKGAVVGTRRRRRIFQHQIHLQPLRLCSIWPGIIQPRTALRSLQQFDDQDVKSCNKRRRRTL